MSTDPIVAGTDGSPRAEVAVDTAGELARVLGAPVHVVCVPGAIAGRDWPQRITAQEIVAASSDRLQSRGITVQTHLPKDAGDAAFALVALAYDVGAQMLVVGNKGMTGVRRLLGSFAHRVSHQATCDVLIVPTQSQSAPQFGGASIVVGVDGSREETRTGEEAIRLAKAFGGSLQIVPVGESSESAASALAVSAVDRGVDAVTHEFQPDAVDAILGVANHTHAAMVVVASEGTAAAAGDQLGSVANELSHKATVCVLIVSSAGAGDGEDTQSGASSDSEAASPSR